MVNQVGVGDEGGAGLVGPVADRHRHGDQARRRVGEHRSVAQGLLDPTICSAAGIGGPGEEYDVCCLLAS